MRRYAFYRVPILVIYVLFLSRTADLVTLMRISPGGPESPLRSGPGSSSVWGMCWAAWGPPSVTWSSRVLCSLQAPAELHVDIVWCSLGEQRGSRGAPGAWGTKGHCESRGGSAASWAGSSAGDQCGVRRGRSLIQDARALRRLEELFSYFFKNRTKVCDQSQPPGFKCQAGTARDWSEERRKQVLPRYFPGGNECVDILMVWCKKRERLNECKGVTITRHMERWWAILWILLNYIFECSLPMFF